MSYAIYTYPEGISLNGRSYVLDAEDGDVLVFEFIYEILEFLQTNGIDVCTEQEMENRYGLFIENEEEQHDPDQ